MIDGQLVDTRNFEDTFGMSDPILQDTSFEQEDFTSPKYLNEFNPPNEFIDVNELLSK
jgi:hypothetical protein